MIENPKVSVVMPVYNGGGYLISAIKSVLSQTFSDFELLILNDASTDGSFDIIEKFKDKRIYLINRKENIGLQNNLFDGFNLAKGKYIARMDQDDICHPNRFAEQVKYLEENLEVGLCGTWCKTIGMGKYFIYKPPCNSDDIRANLLWQTSFVHPSVMMRKSLFKKFNLNYDINFKYGEDYDLWMRASDCFLTANIPKVLLFYRMHLKNTSRIFKKEMDEAAYRVRSKILKKLGIIENEEEKRLHNFLFPREGETVAEFLKKEEKWLIKILEANKKTHFYKTNSLNKVLYERWRVICGKNAKKSFFVWKKYKNSLLFNIGSQKRYWDNLKIFIKCFFILFIFIISID